MSDKRYHVWAFRRHRACYDCGAVEQIEVEPNASAVQLAEDEFNAFLKGAHSGRHDDYVFLYRCLDDNALTPKILELVELGRTEIEQEKERERKRAEKAAEKAAKAQDLTAKKQVEELKKQKKLYAELKAKFEK